MAGFTTKKHADILVIQCPDRIDVNAAKQMEYLWQSEWQNDASAIYVLDFREVKDISNACYRTFLKIKTGIRSLDKSLLSVNLSEEIELQIRTDGISNVLTPTKDLAASVKKLQAPGPAPKLDIEFINPFVTGTKLAIEVQGSTPVEIGKPCLKKSAPPIELAIAAILSIDSSSFSGSIVLGFPKNVFLKIYENMLGEKHTEIDKSTEDAAGEFLNILFGAAKRELNDKKGFTIKKAIPTVVRGDQIIIPQLSQARLSIVIPFKTEVGFFHLEVLFGPFKKEEKP